VLISAITRLFATPPVTLHKAMDPFKVMTSILDKPELGESIIESVLPYIYFSLYRFKDGDAFSRELKQQTTKFLEFIQPKLIWSCAIALWNERIREPEGQVRNIFRCAFHYIS
jgi:hypothetical protein